MCVCVVKLDIPLCFRIIKGIKTVHTTLFAKCLKRVAINTMFVGTDGCVCLNAQVTASSYCNNNNITTTNTNNNNNNNNLFVKCAGTHSLIASITKNSPRLHTK